MTLDCLCLSWKERSREGHEIIFKDLNVFHLGILFLVDIFRFQLEHSAEYKTIQLLFSPHPRRFSLQNWGGLGNSELADLSVGENRIKMATWQGKKLVLTPPTGFSSFSILYHNPNPQARGRQPGSCFFNLTVCLCQDKAF